MTKKLSKKEMDKFMNSTIHVVKENRAHVVVNENAIKMGLEKSIIYDNIHGVKYEDLESHFPYFEPEKVRRLFNELVEEGLLKYPQRENA